MTKPCTDREYKALSTAFVWAEMEILLLWNELEQMWKVNDLSQKTIRALNERVKELESHGNDAVVN